VPSLLDPLRCLSGGDRPCAFPRRVLLPAALAFAAFALPEALLYHGPDVPCGWAAYGVVLAFLFLDGWAALPGLALGTGLGLAWLGHDLSLPLRIAAGALTLALPAASAIVLRNRRQPLDRRLSRVGDIAPFLVHSFLVGIAGSAVWLALRGFPAGHRPGERVEVFLLWTLQQTLGVMVLAPFLLRALHVPAPLRAFARHLRHRPLRLLEELTVYSGIPLVAFLTLFNPWRNAVLSSCYTFVLFAFLVWAAARFGFRGALVFCLLRVVSTLGAARHGHFLYGAVDPLEKGVSLTAYLSLISGTSLLVGMIFEERRNLIVRLTESEGRLQSLLRHSPLPITIKDLRGRYLLVNPAAELSMGRDVRSLLGKTDAEIFPSAAGEQGGGESGAGHAGGVGSTDALVLATRRPVTVEETFTGREGVVHHATTKFPLLDPAGVPQAICSMSIDVTEQQRIERERDRFFLLAPDFFCVLRFDGRIVRANPSFLGFNGLTAEEAFDRSIDGLAHPADRALCRRHFHPGSESAAAEIRWSAAPNLRPGAEPERIVAWTVFADHQAKLLYASGRDVTERKRDERTLLEAIETADRMAREAETANRSKTSFLAVMTHELRTPLNGILGAANLLETTSLDPEQGDYVRIMTNCGESLQRLVTDILDFAKSESGRIVMAQESFDVRAALEEVARTLSPAAAKKGIALRLECGGLPSPLLGDALRLRQVLLNLAGNAVKFSDGGTVTIRAAALREEEAGAARLRFEVEDDGPGIPHEALPLLFKPFSQADASPTRSHGGAGLGLAISKNLVELMDGKIEVQSEPGKGSVFSFTARFPRDIGEE